MRKMQSVRLQIERLQGFYQYSTGTVWKIEPCLCADYSKVTLLCDNLSKFCLD
jgi:hypothetical protein